ncbi:MAG: hypothetical protein A2373_03680 [Candidatus Magasanikbacteria bacterium RIFOXYB1_FULL_40_15]|uniref:DUF4832 domain-containing protein n=1 Tax=Candidatus Magasanikbacteria bacterium RIFOXYB1_FULL_40_15 TaxID=1798697 RepID=A0A1F6NJP4_9BACT|nr:MAG: hypothetical protein A2373_03680 [Candidatus Magasanikbacteria bacterium RIFOXYB1_FULL_40_15]
MGAIRDFKKIDPAPSYRVLNPVQKIIPITIQGRCWINILFFFLLFGFFILLPFDGVKAVCGNGMFEPPAEECECGIAAPLFICTFSPCCNSTTCLVNPGYDISTCANTCGDAVVQPVTSREVCDNGSTINETVYCAYTPLNPGSCLSCWNHCASTLAGTPQYCGDDTPNGPETCDDGVNNGRPPSLVIPPTPMGFFDTSGNSFGIKISGNYAYVADSGGGLRIINISNPSSPTSVGTYATTAWNLDIAGSFAYVAAYSNGLQIINITNPASPSLVGSRTTSAAATDVVVSGNYAYLAIFNTGLQIINISNPASPSSESTLTIPGSNPTGVFKVGNYVYVADFNNRLHIINVTNPASPVITGSYTSPFPIYAVTVFGNYAYASDTSGALRIINIFNPASPSLVGLIDTPGSSRGLFMSGQYIYMTDGLVGGMRIINVSTPTAPTALTSVDTPGNASDVYVLGDYAYVADYGSGLRIFRVKLSGQPNYCNSTCNGSVPPVCGNAFSETGETCDEYPYNGVACIPQYNGTCAYCNNSCAQSNVSGPYCGDGTTAPIFEVCDDSNTITETSANCPYDNPVCTFCRADCGQVLNLTGPYCGDGTRQIAIASVCAGGTNHGNVCANAAQCPGGSCLPVEACDDGNSTDAGTCNSICTALTYCGDGTTQNPNGAGQTEQCDDGNSTEGDGCNSNCTPAVCGNGYVETGEQCDTGGQTATCDTDCTTAVCGDSVINSAAGETCEPPNTGTCNATCTISECGNGLVELGEECDGGGSCGAEITTKTFTESTSDFVNPERGLYQHYETHSSSHVPLSLSSLTSLRNTNGVSLILRIVYLDSFVNASISTTFLNALTADFNTMRNAGVKAILRFAYTTDSTAPFGDATKLRMLEHISQLSPLLNANSDVILTMQTGLIGTWGEWYYTDFFGYPPPLSSTNLTDRAEIVTALLNAFPDSRMIQLRTPLIKQQTFGTSVPLTEVEAYNGTNRARTGHHNDCFLASNSDFGTYVNTTTEYPYLATETLYTPMGGETCSPNPPRSLCPTALAELQMFHWTYLNRSYHPDVISGLISGNCFEDIKRELGYRFVLRNVSYNNPVEPGGALSLSITLENVGYAALFNERPVFIVISDGTTLNLNMDAREWSAGNTHTFNVNLTAPSNPGTYSVRLWMPDNSPSLEDNPMYAIRFANTSVWDGVAGNNILFDDLVVDTDCTGGTGGETATCDADCTAVVCGDSTINTTSGEQCDPPGGTCNASCLIAVCGNNYVDLGEDCDVWSSQIHSDTTTCDANCSTRACNDGYLNDFEVCDTSATNPFDGATCSSVTAGAFPSGALGCNLCNSINTTGCYLCGNGTLEDAEYCDDGNTVSGDGCESTCMSWTTGWSCIDNPASPPAPDSLCAMLCGNNHIDSGEACDDGDNITETAVDCPYGIPSCTFCNATCSQILNFSGPYCGNSIVEVGEEVCDLGIAQNNNPDCSYGLQSCVVCLSDCSEQQAGNTSFCGDREVDPANEDCDYDEGLPATDGDGCSSTCEVEEGYSCGNFGIGGSYTCEFHCGIDLDLDTFYEDTNFDINGDGIIDIDEECDDGPENGIRCAPDYGADCPWCTNSCESRTVTADYCGDGDINTLYEQCDQGNTVGGDGCSVACDIESGWQCFGARSSACSPISGDGICVGAPFESCLNNFDDCGACSIVDVLTALPGQTSGLLNGILNSITDIFPTPQLRINIPGLNLNRARVDEPIEVEVRVKGFGIKTPFFMGEKEVSVTIQPFDPDHPENDLINITLD